LAKLQLLRGGVKFAGVCPLLAARNSSFASEFKLDGNTLWVTTKSEAGQPASETRTKLKRIE
jgi:hypothetical protein